MTDWTSYRDAEKELTEEMKMVALFLETSGSPFEQHLGQTIRAADQVNASRIRQTFPEYWQKALVLARRKVT